jgi:hypothetical protein
MEQYMLTDLQKLALSKLDIEVNRRNISPGRYPLQPFTIEVSGELVVSEDEPYTPTVNIPLIPTVALALKKMGVQRGHFLKVMREAVTEVLLQDTEMRRQLIAQSGLAEFEDDFRRQVLANLPKPTRAGKVNTELTVRPVLTGLAT